MKTSSLGLLHPITPGGPGLGHDLRRPGLGRHQLLDTGTAAHGWGFAELLVTDSLYAPRRRKCEEDRLGVLVFLKYKEARKEAAPQKQLLL